MFAMNTCNTTVRSKTFSPVQHCGHLGHPVNALAAKFLKPTIGGLHSSSQPLFGLVRFASMEV